MKLDRVIRLVLASFVLGLACDPTGQPADMVTLGTSVSFVDGSCSAGGTGCCSGPSAADSPTPSECVLPLDPLHGFPFRVQVTAGPPSVDDAGSSLLSALVAQVSLVQGPPTLGSATTPTSLMAPPVAVTLNPSTDGSGLYTGIVTLNAPGPGPVTVQADVAGSIQRATATIPEPVVRGSAEPTTGWTGSTPRYAVCVETSATAGTIALTSSDPGVLGATSPLSGTLVPGACPAPATVTGGPQTSHTTFTLAFPPPWTVQATLGGMPNVLDAGSAGLEGGTSTGCGSSLDTGSMNPWATTISQCTPTAVGLTFWNTTFSTNGPAGSIIQVTAQATTNAPTAPPIAGIPVTFSAQPSTATVTPTTVTTDPMGKAVTYAFIPYGSQAVVAASTGVVVQQQSISNPVDLSVLEPPVAGTSAMGGTFYTVSAMATANFSPIQGLALTFTAFPAGGVATAPVTATTSDLGIATAVLLVPYAPTVQLEVTGGNGFVPLTTFPNPAPATTTGPITLDTSMKGTYVTQVNAPGGGPGTVYAITTTAIATSIATLTSVPVPGVTVSFAVIYPTGVGAPTVMPASAMTDPSGQATALVAIPATDAGVSQFIQVEVSGGISVVSCEVPGLCVTAQ